MVLFVDAAHCVFAPCLGVVWCVQRLFVQAPSGRQRLHVLAALKALTHEVVTVRQLTYITAETVGERLPLWVGSSPGIPITVILDHARYQRCVLVQSVAQRLGIEWLYLPTYSPNVNLIERFWKFVTKPWLDSKDYPDSESFQHAIRPCIEQALSPHKQAFESLLTLHFQTFQAVPVIGEQHMVSTGSKNKVLSKAA